MQCFTVLPVLFILAGIAAKAGAIDITAADRDILIAIRNKFQCCFEDERKEGQDQYAVVYYGEPNTESVSKTDFGSCRLTDRKVIFLIKPDYTLDPVARATAGCSFVAGRLKDSSAKHTEKTCLYSFATPTKAGEMIYNRCPTSVNKNIYLYTFHNPCSQEGSKEADQKYCTDVISKFAKGCGENYKYLIIGYETEYKDTAPASEKAIDAIQNVGMTKIQVQKKDCTKATAAEQCNPVKKNEL